MAEDQDRDRIRARVDWTAEELRASSIPGVAEGPLREWKRLYDHSKSIEFLQIPFRGIMVRSEFPEEDRVLQLDETEKGIGLRFSRFIRLIGLDYNEVKEIFEPNVGNISWPEDIHEKRSVSFSDLFSGEFRKPAGGQTLANLIGKEIKVSVLRGNKPPETVETFKPEVKED